MSYVIYIIISFQSYFLLQDGLKLFFLSTLTLKLYPQKSVFHKKEILCARIQIIVIIIEFWGVQIVSRQGITANLQFFALLIK